MIAIEKNNCCGCTACRNICPQNAITMKEDFEGFLYPDIDKNRCSNCGLCDNVCPVLNKKEKKEESIEAFSLRTKNKEILKKSTSGGFFTPVAEHIIKNNGIVYGVGFDENLKVCHKEASSLDEINEFKGSKYVQSDLGTTFKDVKKHLENQKIVLFSRNTMPS